MNLSNQFDTLDLFPASKEITEDNLIVFKKLGEADVYAEQKWQEILKIVRDNLSSQSFTTWFDPIRVIRWKDELLTIQVPSQFFQEWIEEHYYNLLQKALQKVLGPEARLQYEVVVDTTPEIDKNVLRVPGFRNPGTSGFSNHKPNEFNTGLNIRYSFDSFVMGDSNQLAYSASKAVANNPGKSFNPLVIIGDSGLGKTHLVQAIGNHIINTNPKAKVLYTNCEDFYLDFVNAIQNNKKNEFVNYYKNVDVFIMDDIHIFADKLKSQDMFFHIFNAFHQADKQIILTCDKPPKELKGVEERLISRVQWGLTVDLQRPDFETRMAILNKKSSDEGINLPQEVVEYIATNATTNVRELEGILISFIAKVTFDNREPSVALAKEVVSGISKSDPKQMTIEDIKALVSEYYKISLEDMESKSRKHEIALSRQMSMYLAKQLTQMSLKSIGAAFGGRDHSTVLHSCTQIENYLVTDKTVKSAFEQLLKTLKSMC